VGGRLDPEGWAATPRGRFVSCSASVTSPRAKFGCPRREGARREWKLVHSSHDSGFGRFFCARYGVIQSSFNSLSDTASRQNDCLV
jgi:hypothetical protein